MEVILTIALAFVVFLLVAVIVATKAVRPRHGVRLRLDEKTGQYVRGQPDESERR